MASFFWCDCSLSEKKWIYPTLTTAAKFLSSINIINRDQVKLYVSNYGIECSICVVIMSLQLKKIPEYITKWIRSSVHYEGTVTMKEWSYQPQIGNTYQQENMDRKMVSRDSSQKCAITNTITIHAIHQALTNANMQYRNNYIYKYQKHRLYWTLYVLYTVCLRQRNIYVATK